ncbi:UNVERIFIED_CONTAM: hypothetical protein Sradi_2638500 [Sesamum radiatum]|uniref:Reverse transcriptase n=1 Tax=Sesamum radiatum TaxID=300843 RepID=A0AAW2S599_SESRA
MDVKTTFLYGEPEEEIYMEQPEGFVAHGSCIEIITETKSCLKNKFEMKDRCEVDVILGIKLIRSTNRVLRYLKGTVSLVIHYGRFPTVLEGYSDASWIAKNSGSNGCSGYVFTLGGGAVS